MDAISLWVQKVGKRKLITGFLALAAALLLPHIPTSTEGFWSTFSPGNSAGIIPIFTIVLCAVYALFSLGLNIVVGFAGLLDLGYVAFFLVGAYVAAWLMSGFFYNVHFEFLSGAFKKEGGGFQPGIHLTFWLVVIIAAIVAALVGVIIGAPTLRLKSDYLALVTLGFGEILPEVFRNAEKVTNGTKGIGPLDQIGSGPLAALPGINPRIGPSDYVAKYYVILAFLALFIFISVRLRDGKLGRAWMAIREDELAASLMGVPLMKTKLWSYAVGAMAGGIGGAFYATIVGTVNVDAFTFSLSIIILCAVILGGMGNVWGAILGGVAITWVNYTGLTFTGTKYNEATSNKLWVTIAVLAVLGALIAARQHVKRIVRAKFASTGSATNTADEDSSPINWVMIAAVAAVPAAGLALAAVLAKAKARPALVGITLLIVAIALVQLATWVLAQKKLQPSQIAIAAATGILVGMMVYRLIRPSFTINLVDYQFGFFGLVLVLMMLFRPEGFIPAARSKAVKKAEAALTTASAQAATGA